MVGWMVGRMVGWMVGRMVGWMDGGSVYEVQNGKNRVEKRVFRIVEKARFQTVSHC